ncbi:MAG: 50S ribosomal protein L4 [Planctomycetota bacterium]|nr:50S ribosomal protein L4 [Planctomycetota bacterium]
MIEVPYFDKEGNKLSPLPVDETVFGKSVRKKLLHEVVLAHLANQRLGTTDTKRRGEVKGASRKPWRQKHTGRARAGTIRSPIWRHGGIIFGPHPRDYSVQLPRAMKRAALDSAILAKLLDGSTMIVQEIAATPPKTKPVSRLLSTIGVKGRCLLGSKDYDKNVWLASRNLPRLIVAPVRDFNAYDVVANKFLVMTKSAFDWLVEQRTRGAVSK